MRRSATVFVSLAALVALGCSDYPAATGHDRVIARSFDFMNGPAEAGPVLFRTADDDFFLLLDTDRETDLATLIRLPDPPSDVTHCGGSQPLVPADLQLVFHSNDAINSLLIGREARAYVYERHTFVAAAQQTGICGAIATQAPLAQGSVDFVSHDNDTFFSGAHADAFGWSASGVVVSAFDGSLLRLLDESHGVLGADGSLLNAVSRITLTPLTAP